jgi:hypothetical protein
MSSAVLDSFPRRPIALAGAAKTARGRRLWLIGALLLLLVPLYAGYQAWQRVSLRADLNARGERAEVIDAEGSCTSRRGASLGCHYTIRYRLRGEESGEVREGNIYVPGEGPRIFAPPAVYDPADPARIMSLADLERGEPFMNVAVPVVLPAVLAMLCLLVWYAMGNKALARAAAAPQPALVPVQRFEPVPNTRIVRVHFERPDGSAASQNFNGFRPLLVTADGRDQALALLGPGDRPILLSEDLRELELSGDERARILGAATG